MADIITGKVWLLDTVAGFVSSNPVTIHAIHVKFTTAGAGACVLSTANTPGDIILDLTTTAASTAVVFDTTVRYTFGDQVFLGLRKVTCTNISTIHIVTCNQK